MNTFKKNMAQERFIDNNWKAIVLIYPELKNADQPDPGTKSFEDLIARLRADLQPVINGPGMMSELGLIDYNSLPPDRQLMALEKGIKFVESLQKIAELNKKQKLP